jgi:hypothetical protein
MKIKHYTFFTNSHRIFLKYFLNTFKFDENIDLCIRHMPQECLSGDYVSEGWNDTMKRKVDYIIDVFDELKEGSIFVHSDADIVFIKPYKDVLLQEMGDSDLIFQNDWNGACMGFFACKVSEKTKNLFLKVKEDLHNHEQDQACVNFLLNNTNHGLKYKLFSHKFYNYGFTGKIYNNEEDFFVPNDIVVLHANFAVGVEKKRKIISIVLKKFNMI